MKYIIFYFLNAIIVITNAMVFNSSALKNKLIDNHEVAEGEMSFVVSLRIYKVHFCSGGLISESHVLTIAKCAVYIFHHGGPNFEYASVLIGTNNLLSNKTSHAIRMIDAYGFIPHWPVNIQGYGMGLVMLSKPFFDLNASWLSILKKELTGKEITSVIGWNFLHNAPNIRPRQPNILRIINVKLFEPEHCLETFSQGQFELRDACGIPLGSEENTSLRDIGSILIVKNDEGEPELAGFVTAVLKKKNINYIRFNRVFFYLKYINNLLENEMNPNVNNLKPPLNEYFCHNS